MLTKLEMDSKLIAGLQKPNYRRHMAKSGQKPVPRGL